MFDREGLRVREHELQDQIDSMLATLDRQTQDLHAAQQQVAQLRVSAESADGLVQVVVNSVGGVVDVRLARDVFRRSTPESLGRAMTEASRRAGEAAHTESMRIMGSIVSATETLPDLPDLVPGAPSLRDFLPRLEPGVDAVPADRDLDPDDPDDARWNRPVLRDGWQ
ncbi:YbaB/EbfC family nucleoid-associated protein [Rhodococcus sp. JS3073]|uniref:YbaB/EbfC family nucleoid-associated protein n=1 Tax=Rhodococcus sp. JS3073 TaxID=3002901 RepID=UPI0022860030|nr:YbaB/EbfC family nucleoid-associated protein [Rhodococcus sp. JS3073]WAM16081.1 YbaB/EbfC family nucleoid-associated protein [Rhodococcus sp. JS3073]